MRYFNSFCLPLITSHSLPHSFTLSLLTLLLTLFISPSVDNLSGPTSPSGIKPEDLTDDVFSYIFLAKPLPTGVSTPIPQELLQSMRDVRVSIQGIISFFSSKSSAAIHLLVPLFCICLTSRVKLIIQPDRHPSFCPSTLTVLFSISVSLLSPPLSFLPPPPPPSLPYPPLYQTTSIAPFHYLFYL